MPTKEVNSAFKAKLESLKIPHENITVFGAINCNITIACLSEKSAIFRHSGSH